jgi:riboflavin kinase/FMN adenylyltransferase
MDVFQYFSELKKWEDEKIVCTIGNFDGVHAAHHAILEKVKAEARRHNAKSFVITFKNHPLQVGVQKQKPILTSIPHKLILLDRAGIDGCFVVSFTQRLKDMQPIDFLNTILFKHFNMCHLIVGYNFFFGKNRSGTTDLIARETKKRGIGFEIAQPIKAESLVVSSSRIRELIGEGQMKEAERLLGRKYSVLATVVKGAGRGTTLGFPTANLDVHSEVLPPKGVYIVHVNACVNTFGGFDKVRDMKPDCCFTPYKGVLNLGVNPTFGSRIPFHAEVHIPNVSEDFHGKLLEVTFYEKLRDEKKFDSAETLCAQIAKDLELVAAYNIVNS